MMRTSLIVCALLTGCSDASRPIAQCTDCDDGNPCTVDSSCAGTCEHASLPDGVVCGGDQTSDVHGRCAAGLCAWTDWTVAAPCETEADCTGAHWRCERRRCANGSCSQEFAPDGTPDLTDEFPGDCTMLVCNGRGDSRRAYSSTDYIDDGNPCTIESCSEGGPVRRPAADGVACLSEGAFGACSDGYCIPVTAGRTP